MKKYISSLLLFSVATLAFLQVSAQITSQPSDQPVAPVTQSMNFTYFLTGGGGLLIILIAVLVRRRRMLKAGK
jgi:hypothetical protein